MNTRTTIPISKARAKIFDIADEVQKASNHYTLTERGKPRVVIISAKDFESYQETLEAIKDFPRLEKDIEKAEKEYKKGDVSTLDQVLLKKGYVSSSSRKKHGKRSE